ncbi:MAG TPA: acyl-CoA dehydrogenase family protein [Acidimicrobiales bacterium]|nr:acyl-CoA dehydrogenase family protein [Acidimicrobiales bacterium]
MTITDESAVATKPAGWVDELKSFLDDNWNPDLSVGEWWERLGSAGWAAPMLPVESYGRALSRPESMVAGAIIAQHGALGAPLGMGISMVAPTIATHGTRAQIERYIPDAVCGRLGWCQLFSEPGAGSDLAGLSTKAVKDGDVWVINGQKVWTSGGHMADMGMLLARTNPTAPKHQGISWFAFDMHQPGHVEVRPLKEMTGHTMFSEVFFTDAVVEAAAIIGDVNDGWTVANTTLFHERSGMGMQRGTGVGGGGGVPMARAGTVANDLAKCAGDFVRAPREARAPGATRERTSPASLYINLAREQGKNTDPVIRQRLAQAHTLGELARFNAERGKAVRAKGGEIPGLANFAKLLTADILRLNRDLGMQLLGARGMLHAYTDEERQTLVNAPLGGVAHSVTGQALGAQALPIFGGTDQIQKNIVSERALGLPKEPGDLSRVPFNELPKNG